MTGFMALGQDNSAKPQRTPEQEAIKQTDKLQQELNLNGDQAKQIYEINLRYARERQFSNKRSEAMERMKNKTAEIQQVLSQEQFEKLQSKRFERTNPEPVNGMHAQSVNPPAFQSNTEMRTSPSIRVIQGNAPVRSTFSTSTQRDGQNSQSPQAVHRKIPTEQSQPPRVSNPASVRQHFSVPAIPHRTEQTPAASNRR